MQIRTIITAACLLLIDQISAQSLATMLDSVVTTACNQPCVTLHADIFDAKKTNTYTVGTQTYNPQSFTGGTSLSLSDDKFSSSINIGFNFCFYENTYSSLVIGANGILTFNPAYANQNCSFSTMQTLPYFNSTFADNAIFGPFVDINLSQGGNINYYTTGTAPWRKFVVNFNNANYFSTSCPSVLNTFQIVLHESSNEVEVNIANKGTCNSNTNDWLNYATLGIQNIGATVSTIATGKNASIWTSSNESYLFSPAGAKNYTIDWYANATLLATDVDTVTVCSNLPNYTDYYFNYTLLCPSSTISDTALITMPIIYPDSVHVSMPTCYNNNDAEVTIFPANPNFEYKKDNDPYTNNNVFTNLGSGLYTFYMRDTNGCVWDSTINFIPTTTLFASVDSSTPPLCGQMNGAIYTSTTGGIPPYTYSWNLVGNTTEDITGVGPGTYVMTVTDSVGCEYNLFYLLNDITGINLDSMTVINPVCGDSTGSIEAHISGGTPPYTYSWNLSTSTTNVANNLWAGYHILTIIDSNGCDTSIQVPLVNQYVVFATLDTVNTSCGLDNGIATVTPTAGLAPFTYLWNNGTTDSMNTGLASGFHFCTITASNGCTSNESFFVENSIVPSISLSWTNAYCDSNNGIAVAYVQDMTAPWTYSWSSGSIQDKAENLAPGWAVITVTDSVGCVLVDSAFIDNDGSPHLEIVSYTAPLCHGDSTGTVVLTASGGTPPYKYSTDGAYFQTTAKLDSMPGGNYYLYVRDANSCTKDTLINFPQPDLIQFSVSHDSIICYGDKTDIRITSSSGGQGYHLFDVDGSGFRRDSVFPNKGAGSYTVTVKDSVGCFQEMTVFIDGPNTGLGVDFDMVEIPCYEETGGEISATPFGGWGNYSVLWSNGFTGNTQQDLPEGWYVIQVTDNRGCEIIDSVELVELECCEAWLPSAFTPDGDGKNDYFEYYTRSDIEDVIFEIRNRYGELMFYSIHPSSKWDGVYNNKIADVGVYFYSLRYKCSQTKDWIELHGDMTLIR